MNEKNALLIAITAVATILISCVLGFVFEAKAALLGLFLVPSMVISFINPRWGLLALLIYLPFSSTIAFSVVKVFKVLGNYIQYSKSYPLYKIAKDAFYFPALLGILLKSRSFQELRPKIKPLFLTITILVAASLLTFLLVNFPQQKKESLILGVVGLKILLGYIPLILCGYYLVQEKKDLHFVSRLFIILIIICCVLCLIQYFLLVQGICPNNITLNKVQSLIDLSQTKYYPDITDKTTLKAQCLVGGSILYNPNKGLIRLPGTFSDPWQWSWFLISSSFISYAASISDTSQRWRIAGWVAMACVFGATLVSGQRIALLIVPVVYLILLIITEKRKKQLLLKLGIIALLSLIVATQVGFFQQKIDNFIARWNYSPPTEFMFGQMRWIMQQLNFLGHGLGGATSAARRLVTEDGPKLIETYYVKLIYEIGIFGFLAFMAVVTVLSVLTFKAYRSLKDSSLRNWAVCLWAFVFFISYNPYYYPLSVEPVSIYYWLFAGILLKLPKVDLNLLQEIEEKEYDEKYITE